jgi:hypothetical protein
MFWSTSRGSAANASWAADLEESSTVQGLTVPRRGRPLTLGLANLSCFERQDGGIVHGDGRRNGLKCLEEIWPKFLAAVEDFSRIGGNDARESYVGCREGPSPPQRARYR